MKIQALRILPPFAIGRLGSATHPMDNYAIEEAPRSLGYRKLIGEETLVVDDSTGEITSSYRPRTISFKTKTTNDKEQIRPVAPFLELFAVVLDDWGQEVLLPVDSLLLEKLGVNAGHIQWRAKVANRKILRRTEDHNDLILAETPWFSDHDTHELQGLSANFLTGAYVSLGHVRFIRPNQAFPEIRLRFTPAKGLIYGPATEPPGQDPAIPAERAIYDTTKGSWKNYGEDKDKVLNETVPPSLYAINPPAPTWLNNNIAVSRGYFDDACDGFVEVSLTLLDGTKHEAKARICAAPPAVIPDSLFIRTLADDLEQVIEGPEISPEQLPHIETARVRALDIVRRAYETVRFMNVMVMNGNDFKGRSALSLDSMPEEEAADTERAIRPVMAPGTVDTLAIMNLHEHVFAALRGGSAPWFARLLRQPNEVSDFTDRGRRKMPALMCGADNNYLALTHRQINLIKMVAEEAPYSSLRLSREVEPFVAKNRTAQLNFSARGNPTSSRPISAVANCCPGLEVDFRAVWRRVFKGIVLREYDNLVLEAEDNAYQALVGQQLLRIRLKDATKISTTAEILGPASSDPLGAIVLTTSANPNGLAALEWSNLLAPILSRYQGKTVTCDFTKDLANEDRDIPQQLVESPCNYVSLDFEVRHFFEDETAVIAEALAASGELTQGLCSPWQNDYRECSCYYWASARPDYVNVEVAGNGLSKGDNWFQKERTGDYVVDDYVDKRLVLYDDLFTDWERWLRFQVGGRDAEEIAPE